MVYEGQSDSHHRTTERTACHDRNISATAVNAGEREFARTMDDEKQREDMAIERLLGNTGLQKSYLNYPRGRET